MKRNAGLCLGAASLFGFLIVTSSCSSQGSDSGSGGATGSGGASAQGGASGTGGAAGSGTTGSGGSTGVGGMTAAGGTTGGTGGATGSMGGQSGAAGSSMGGATGAGGAALNIADIVPGLDGYYWEATPSGNTALSGTNYPFGPAAGGCPQGATWDTTGYINTKTMAVKGTAGQKYTINFGIRGVSGTRCYTGGTPATTSTTPDPSGPNNTWYVGGKQFNDSIWNTYEIHVTPPVTGAANTYFANSFPNVSNWCQKEASYQVKYNASFPVTGGGTISFVIHDTNCRTLANCGAVENQATCDTTAARTIDMSGLSPAPVNFTQPRTVSLGNTTYYVQWLWIDVTSVTSP